MEHSDANYQSLLGSGASIRRLMGLWWSQGRRGRLWSAVAATVTVGSLALLTTFSALKLIMDTPSELEEITLCCFVMSIAPGFLTKAVLFIYQGDTLKHLLKLMSGIRRLYRNNKRSDDIRHSYQILSGRVYLYMQVAVVPAYAGWVSIPLLARFFFNSDDDSIESNHQFPVPLWFPGNIYVAPTYEILYGIQSFCILVTAQSAICIDVFFFHVMLMVAAELQVLNENISVMQKLNVKIQGYEDYRFKFYGNNYELTFPRNALPISPIYSRSAGVSDNKMCHHLVKNIRHHQEIIRCFHVLQSVMNVSIFTLLFVNMADLCSCMFVTAVLLQRDGNVTKALKPMLTIPPLLYETGMYCIFGQIITDQSEKLVNSAMSSGWVDCDPRFKHDLLFFLMAAKKPLEITVGKMSKLSKQMLVQVLNGSYALLNVLYHFHSTQ
ncbi:uncharacterized protein LOC126279086 [Schistocerca gregaria]|uniref:uncharacterized protein LOC126279086 n=1 Tax=Schistocerca gregaria TaxID=7010 RepID=UPI00211F3574|nr:uncharacterized protein LOC126279086 [Schistocerca gregaria]